MPANPQRLQEVFLAAIEVTDPAARSALLDRECAADPELRQRVETLLRADQDPASILKEPAAWLSEPQPSDETVGLEPALIMAFDAQVFGQAGNNGQMLSEISPKSPAAEGIRRIAELVTGRTPQVVEKASPILSFLKGKKRA